MMINTTIKYIIKSAKVLVPITSPFNLHNGKELFKLILIDR